MPVQVIEAILLQPAVCPADVTWPARTQLDVGSLERDCETDVWSGEIDRLTVSRAGINQ